ncbi:pentatricopeptide repeat-containing protein At5g66520-like [Aristolochia californica]|uniref:pentatricopeptide repeat-containing protein At5g66520-like n=1 Tax=Aristolochia californica TaxID=171875 RepID=UPI0035D70DBA
MPSPRTIIRVVDKCKNIRQLGQTHAQIIVAGLGDDKFAISRLMDFCSNPVHGDLKHTWTLFQRTDYPTICICNTMIKAFFLNGDFLMTAEIYMGMLLDRSYPDNYTLPYILKACSNLQDLRFGEQVHSHVVKLGFVCDIYVGNTLMLMYSVFGDMRAARYLFDIIPQRTEVAWTVMISGYSKQGDVDSACFLFDEAPVKDRGIWGSMISGYVQNNCFKEGLKLFQLMQLTNVDLDESVLVSVLGACAQLGALELGIWIHKYVERIGLSVGVRFGTALVDMYNRCGRLGLAKKVFNELPQRDSVCWNVMILGLAMHGDGEGAFKLFLEMKDSGFTPDGITFIAIFTACSHCGEVERGLDEFHKMKSVYNIEPKCEHYGCVVDFLGRAGLFEEAIEIIQKMPVLSNTSEEAIVWRALLSACFIHWEINLAELAAKHLVQLERHSGAYVLLSNIYAAAGRYRDAVRVRKLMKEKGVQKVPGSSSIEVHGVVQEFIAGEETHPEIEEIFRLLEKMNTQLESG